MVLPQPKSSLAFVYEMLLHSSLFFTSQGNMNKPPPFSCSLRIAMCWRQECSILSACWIRFCESQRPATRAATISFPVCRERGQETFLSPNLNIKKLLKCQGFPFCSAEMFPLLRKPPLNPSVRMTVHQRPLKGNGLNIRVRTTVVSIWTLQMLGAGPFYTIPNPPSPIGTGFSPACIWRCQFRLYYF